MSAGVRPAIATGNGNGQGSGGFMGERAAGYNSKVVGLYQSLLRQQLDHFFPDARLEPAGDRSFIGWDDASRPRAAVVEEPDGFGLEIEWFRSRHLFMPATPAPFRPAERRLVETIVHALDARYRALFDRDAAERSELFQHAVEDTVVAEFLGTPAADRIPEALGALRVAALSTYENRRVSTGAILLGTHKDPADPERANVDGAPRYDVRLTAIKGLHRLCDGVRTLFVVDRRGDLAWAVDVDRWADRAHGPGAALPAPCPRAFASHARATRAGGHVVLVLSPSQEIKVFADGVLAFAYSDARWRLMDLPTKFAAWQQAVGASQPPDLAERLFSAALNLAESRIGGLFAVLRDPSASLPQLVAPGDQIAAIVAEAASAGDDSPGPELDAHSPRLAKRALHHLVHGLGLGELDASVLESLASLDGAVVADRGGRLLAFGAILRITPEAILAARAVEGARTVAALAASYHGPVLKVSQDGLVAMYLSGRRVWEL